MDDFHFALAAAYTAAAKTPCAHATTPQRSPRHGSLGAALAAADTAAADQAAAPTPNDAQRKLVSEVYMALTIPLDERFRMAHLWLPPKADTPESLASFGKRGRWE